MDAENRLQHLEVIRPTENINLLNVKFHTLQHPRHARPILPQYRDDYVNTFYDQTGTYVQERSGLYHTENYQPHLLVQAIPELENQDQNNLDDLSDKTKSKLFQYRAIGDYQNMRVSSLIYSINKRNKKRRIFNRFELVAVQKFIIYAFISIEIEKQNILFLFI
jgi:hypothetical protein